MELEAYIPPTTSLKCKTLFSTPDKKQRLSITDSLTPKDIDLNSPRCRRVRKQPVLYDPQTCAASVWQSDFHLDKSTDSFSDDYSTDEESEAKAKKRPSSIWCDFCHDDKSITVCCFCACRVCFSKSDEENILLCDNCDAEYHTYCLTPKLKQVPKQDKWYCPNCVGKDSEKKSKKRKIFPIVIKIRLSCDEGAKGDSAVVPRIEVESNEHIVGTPKPSDKFIDTSKQDQIAPDKRLKIDNVTVKREGEDKMNDIITSKLSDNDVKEVQTKSNNVIIATSISNENDSSENKDNVTKSPIDKKTEITLQSLLSKQDNPNENIVTHIAPPSLLNVMEVSTQIKTIIGATEEQIQESDNGKSSTFLPKPKENTVTDEKATIITKTSSIQDNEDNANITTKVESKQVITISIKQNQNIHLKEDKHVKTSNTSKTATQSKDTCDTSVKENEKTNNTKVAVAQMLSVTNTLKPINSCALDDTIEPPTNNTSLQAMRESLALLSSSMHIPIITNTDSNTIYQEYPSAVDTAKSTEPTATKQPRRKPGARECMQISRRFGVNVIPQKYMDVLLDYCTRGKVEHLIRMRERLDEHSRMLELQLAGLECLVKEKVDGTK